MDDRTLERSGSLNGIIVDRNSNGFEQRIIYIQILRILFKILRLFEYRILHRTVSFTV